MNYIPHTNFERREMLDTIGVNTLDDLFDAVPAKYRFPDLNLPEALTEMEALWELQSLADANADMNHYACFLGAGAYNHYIPSLVDHMIRRGEFFTTYTPYQPEVSQGTLQAIFEFQSMIGNLTGLEICTASHYDGATALTEAALMAVNTTGRRKIVVSPAVHPHYRQTLHTYVQFKPDLRVTGDENPDTVSRIDELLNLVDEDTACLCIANPNFFGQFEE
ncbi:MAG: glycine dehydrogenase, partial [Candidatus Roseilinea sp.]